MDEKKSPVLDAILRFIAEREPTSCSSEFEPGFCCGLQLAYEVARIAEKERDVT